SAEIFRVLESAFHTNRTLAFGGDDSFLDGDLIASPETAHVALLDNRCFAGHTDTMAVQSANRSALRVDGDALGPVIGIVPFSLMFDVPIGAFAFPQGASVGGVCEIAIDRHGAPLLAINRS